MKITGEAVEAAIAAFHERREGHDQWAGPNSMRAALEAALPHLSQGAGEKEGEPPTDAEAKARLAEIVAKNPEDFGPGTNPLGDTSAALPHMDGVSVKDALAQLSDAIAREEKEREASDRVFTTLRVNIEKSEPTAEFAEALRDYWLKEGKPALASHEPAPTDTQEGVNGAGEVVGWAYRGPRGGLIVLEEKPSHAPEAEPLVRQSALTACQQEVERLTQERDEALEAENEAKDCFWAIYPDWVDMKGHGITTEAARTLLADRAEAAEARNAELVKALEKLTRLYEQEFDPETLKRPDWLVAALGGQSK